MIEKEKNFNPIQTKEHSSINIPQKNLLGKKFEHLNKMFPILLPKYHNAIISEGHKGMFLNNYPLII